MPRLVSVQLFISRIIQEIWKYFGHVKNKAEPSAIVGIPLDSSENVKEADEKNLVIEQNLKGKHTELYIENVQRAAQNI